MQYRFGWVHGLRHRSARGRDELLMGTVRDLLLSRCDRQQRGFESMGHRGSEQRLRCRLAEAIRYAIARRDTFERFLTDDLIEPDPNIVERAIRPQTITCKNSLFTGSDGSGRTLATIATLLQTCKMHNVDPAAWLTQTVDRIASQLPSAESDVFRPWNYSP